ncbi:MAG: TonB-dependent receptor [Candidatus Cloacimonadales bacterium]|nr:TonB-dependent receptor [Candidatus Cloacimonadales bacterium]
MKKRIFIIAVIFSFQILFAGTTGKLAGKISDESGNVIVYANLQIIELELGTQADEKGNYILRNLPPGIYEITCSQISFQTHRIKSVKIVSDETTILNITLSKSAREIEGIQISEARTKMVDRLKTSSGNTISEAVIEDVAVQDIEDLIAIQAGAIMNDGELHIRGGKVNEIVFLVDGLSINDLVDGEAALTVDVDAIKEMKVMTGGFPAEYGNAQSGIINIITREGGEHYSGKIELNSDHLLSSQNLNSDRVKFALSGPVLPFLKQKLTFFFNCAAHRHDSEFKDDFGANGVDELRYLYVLWDDYEFYDPYEKRKNTLGFDTNDRLYNLYNLNLKLKYQISPLQKVTFSMRGDDNSWQPYDHAWRYALQHYKVEKSSQQQFVMTYDNLINPSMLLNIKAGLYQKQAKEGPRGVSLNDYFAKNPEGFDLYAENLPGNCDGIDYVAEDGYLGDPNLLGYWIYKIPIPIPPYYYYENIDEFLIPGSVYPENVDNKNESYTLKADFNWQITPVHDLKTGLEVVKHHINKFKHTSPWNISVYRYNRYLENNAVPQDSIYLFHPVFGYYYHYFYGLDDIYAATQAASGETYGFIAEPWQGAFYVQDKMEWEGLVVNAGVRLDAWYLGDKYQILNEFNEYEWVKFKKNERLQFMVSPRLGVSHVISMHDVLHFSFNYQSQLPQMQYVYADATWLEAIIGEDPVTKIVIANPDLDPQVTIVGEVGLQHQFNEDYVADITVYYKKNFNYISIDKIYKPDEPTIKWYQYISENYGTAKGIDVNIQKMLSNFIVGSLSYSLSWAEGTDARIFDYENQDMQSLREFPLDWDVRHSIGFNVALEVRKGEELYIPFSGIKFPVDDFSINFLYNFASGTPFTDWSDLDYETNNARKPYTDVAHLKITKNFQFSNNKKIKVYCTINNLFDKENIEFAYIKTGSPYNDGSEFIYEETEHIHNIYTKNPGNVSFGRELIIGLAYSW